MQLFLFVMSQKIYSHKPKSEIRVSIEGLQERERERERSKLPHKTLRKVPALLFWEIKKKKKLIESRSLDDFLSVVSFNLVILLKF